MKSLSLPLLAALLAFVAITISVSRVPRFEQRRVARGTTISLSRSSPPYAALEDDLMDSFETLPPAVAALPAISLEAGRHSFEPLAARIRIEAQAEARRWSEEGRRVAAELAARDGDAVRARRRVDAMLASFSLRAQLEAADEVAGRIARAQRRAGPGALEVRGLSARPGATERESGSAVAAQGGPRQSIKLSDLGINGAQGLAALFAPIVAEGGPELARKFAQAAGASAEQSDRAAVVVYQASVARAPAPAIPTRLPVYRVAPARSVAAASPQASAREPKLNEFAAIPVAAMVVEPAAALALEAQPQVVVSGALEMSAGLAITSPRERLAVYREENGQTMESGAVSFKEGRYEILVGARRGRIVAELRSPSGEALGRGVVELESLGPATSRFRYDQVDVKLAPIPSGFIGLVAGADDVGGFSSVGLKAVRGARIEFDSTPLSAAIRGDGAFDVRRALEGSTAIARVTKPGFWTSLAFAAAGVESRLTLFANGAVAALLGAASPRSTEASARRDSAIAWGRVTKDGRPALGARVELLTAVEGVTPTYFNDAGQPDATLKQTSANGLYAFLPVLPGVQLVQAALGGDANSETVVFPAEAGATSRADIEISFNQRLEARVFDAFHTSAGLSARLASFGREQVSETDATGRGEARLSTSGGIAFVDVDAGGEYATSRVSVARDRRQIIAPMLRSSWLDGLIGELRITQAPATGAIVGFAQGERNYRVRLDAAGEAASKSIIYFDQTGSPTREEFGRPGGGFAIFNAPEGLRTLAIEGAQSERWSFQTVLVERKVVDVALFWLR